MAEVTPLQLSDILEEIHLGISQDTDYPASSDDDYLLRRSLVNRTIRVWENTPGVKWRQLFMVKTGQTIATEGDSTFACAADFRKIAGKLKLIGDSDLVVPVYSMERLDDDDLPDTYAYFTGKPGSFTLNLIGVPASHVGANIRYRYRRFATKLVEGADVPDMTDPNFIVLSVIAILCQMNKDTSGYTVNFNDASVALENMVTENLENEADEEEEPISGRIHNLGAGMGA